MGIKEEIFLRKTGFKIDDSVKGKIEFSKAYIDWIMEKSKVFKSKYNIETIEGYEKEFINFLENF